MSLQKATTPRAKLSKEPCDEKLVACIAADSACFTMA